AAGVQVEVAGLCVTYDGDPFEPLPALMAVAAEGVKLTAVCSLCGGDAPFHIRLRGGGAGAAVRLRATNIGGTGIHPARRPAHRGRGPGCPRLVPQGARGCPALGRARPVPLRTR